VLIPIPSCLFGNPGSIYRDQVGCDDAS